MCGIVGYVGTRGSLPILIDGLKRLEYRGYDSAGIAYQNGKGIEICKTKGKIRELEALLPDPFPMARIGLGHTRWATHGIPSSRNAHPHLSRGVAVVHNGIIENYHELKEELTSSGHDFISDTDTEVVPQLIAFYMKKEHPLPDAIRAAVARLKGTYAIGVMSDTQPDTLFAVRKGSPLVIGLGEDEFFFASDMPAILPYTRTFILMEDGQICSITLGEMTLDYLDGRAAVPVRDSIIKVDWTPSMAEKEGYEHFMLKEIHEQQRAVTDTLRGYIDHSHRLPNNLGIPAEVLQKVRRIQIVACGTSYHAGLVGSYIIERFARLPVDVAIASEYRYRNPILEEGTLLISITQSGETADTLAAQREAKRRGATVLTICNVLGSTSSREADHVLYTKAGPEIGVASTKAFTSQMTVLYLLALKLGADRDVMSLDNARGCTAQLLSLAEPLARALKTSSLIADLAGTLTSARGFLFLGRGINYPIALEGALKLKEISYIPAEGYPAGEMKHGPIALIEERSPVVVVAPADELFEKILSNIEEVKARGGRVIAITDAPDALAHKADDVIEIPSVHPALTPFVTVLPLQLLAYHIAVLKGCDVDQPRNLAKSVTVE
ncbi:MAG: glutamine--fructose-6-phosphate transaminase (isomerizing) [Nitrospirota bacterium]